MGNQQYTNNGSYIDSSSSIIPFEGGVGISANRPRKSSIIRMLPNYNNKENLVIPNERCINDDSVIMAEFDGIIDDTIITSSLHKHEGHEYVTNITTPQPPHDMLQQQQCHYTSIPSSSLLRSYGGIAALGDLVDRLWKRSINDPRLRLRLLAYTINHDEGIDNLYTTPPPECVKKAWLQLIAHSLLATPLPDNSNNHLTYLLLPPPPSSSSSSSHTLRNGVKLITNAFSSVLPTTQYHLSALLENFAMVSQDIAISYGDGLPNNKDIANAIRSIINTSTPTLIIKPKLSPPCSTEYEHNNDIDNTSKYTVDDVKGSYTCCFNSHTLSSSSSSTATPSSSSSGSSSCCSSISRGRAASSSCTTPILYLCLTPLTTDSQMMIQSNNTSSSYNDNNELVISGAHRTTISLLNMLGGVDGITRLVNRTVEIIAGDIRVRAYYIRHATSESTSPNIRSTAAAAAARISLLSGDNNNVMSRAEETTICVVARIIPSLINYLVNKISCYSTLNEQPTTTTAAAAASSSSSSVSQAHRFLPLSDYHFDCVCQNFHTALNDCGITDNNIASHFGVILESCRSEVLEGYYKRKSSPWKYNRSNSITSSIDYHISSPKDINNTRAIGTSSDDIIDGSNYYMDNQRTSGWAEVHSNGRVIQLDTARSMQRKEKIYSTTIQVGSHNRDIN